MKIAWTPIIVSCLLLLTACSDEPLNNPYSEDESQKNILYASFAERPKTLDPARAYSSNEYQFIGQIYEPPLQYHYLLRPYKLVPLAAQSMPSAEYFDAAGKKLPESAEASQVARTVYTIHIKAGRAYQPHPALAKDEKGQYRYHHMGEDFLDDHDIRNIMDFPFLGSRDVTAEDFVYQIKRLASPTTQSPILGLMNSYIVGLEEYAKTLQEEYQKKVDSLGKIFFFDLRDYPLDGAKVIDKETYQIAVKGKYPQFVYWLAMPFFSPMPWEAEKFYSQLGMDDLNLSLDWYPIGSGPYYLRENNPNRQMVLEKNPNFSGETYPSEGEREDTQLGLLRDAGKALPFIQTAIYSLEKEAIPRWSKFLQGYYDSSGIGSDSFDQAIRMDQFGNPNLTPEMQHQAIKLYTMVSSSDFYMGFNMLDDVVGGLNERARKLRQALSIAIDYEEYISIFLNGRGIVAQGPIPPGIFGHLSGESGINPYVYIWSNNRAKRKSLNLAKKLLEQAGYPNGRDEKTGVHLVLNFDVPASSGPDDKARFDWLRKQFAKLGIQLNVRSTQYNRFQEKMRNGNAQIFEWGWHADYPDPENFLFLLYGKNGKVSNQGENAANYQNPEYDLLFDKMKSMNSGPERKEIIDKMLEIARNDAPWIWGFHPKNFVLAHHWNRVSKPNELANNTLKYARLDPVERAIKRKAWNKPIFWPIWLVLGLFLITIIPVWWRYREGEHKPRKRIGD